MHPLATRKAQTMTMIKEHPARAAADGPARPVTSQARLASRPVIPLMGPADPDTVTPLLGAADPGTTTPLLGPADPDTVTPLLGPADPDTVTPLLGAADPGIAAPLMARGSRVA